MKTYLTGEQFVDLFWTLHEKRMKNYNPAETVCDRIVWSMFQEYEKDVKETLEGSLYGIDEFDGSDASELIGYQFHKSFRQTDVIPAKHIDSIVWSCIQDAPMFWKTMNKACKILVSKDAAEIYLEEA